VGPARDPRRIELADIVRAHGAAVQQAQRLTRGQHRALRAIATCRTSALGGHTEGCDVCGAVRIAYNSCRNRHCPKCQTLAKERWLAARRAELLPVEYFHVVFTLPHPLNPLAQGNPRVIYSLLFRAAADTLAAFGQDPKYLGGELGLIAILHTWGQALVQHLHLHCVVPGGALARDGARWLSAKRGFLFPVRALAAVFRGKYLDLLRRTFDRQEITFAGRAAGLADPKAFGEFLAALRQHAWVVYAKPPFAGPAQVLEYLGRYTHRVAISNDRLVSLEEGVVRFRWKDYAHGNTVKTMALPSEAFLHRFLLHVVPAPLPPPRRPGRLRAHPPFRAVGQPGPRSQARPVSGSPRPAAGGPTRGPRIRGGPHPAGEWGGPHPLPRVRAGPAPPRRPLPAGGAPRATPGLLVRGLPRVPPPVPSRAGLPTAPAAGRRRAPVCRDGPGVRFGRPGPSRARGPVAPPPLPAGLPHRPRCPQQASHQGASGIESP